MDRLQRLLVTAAPGAAALLAAAALTRALARRAERRYPRPAGAVTVDGVELRYTVTGAGRPVVLVHGLLGSTYDYHALAALLSSRFRVVAFDRPGNGYSAAPPDDGHSPIGQALLLHEAIRRLGIERPLVVGYSLGAAVAAAWAALYPDDVAAVVTVGGHVMPYRLPAARLARLLRVPLVSRFVASTLLVPLAYPVGYELLALACSPQPLPRAYAHAALAVALRPGPLRHAAQDLERATPDLRTLAGAYGELDLPFVVVVGAYDRIAPAAESEAFHRRLRHSRLIVVGDGGHALHVTHAPAVAAAIDAAWSMADRAVADRDAAAGTDGPSGDEAAGRASA
jgi:pimeloyl-ACP methyl ester carboxylesterase